MPSTVTIERISSEGFYINQIHVLAHSHGALHINKWKRKDLPNYVDIEIHFSSSVKSKLFSQAYRGIDKRNYTNVKTNVDSVK